MRTIEGVVILAVMGIAGCSGPGDGNRGSASPTANQSAAQEPGGTITVGEESWTIVPSISCSVYPGGIVNIAGHAAENPELEIVIDWGGPNQARIAESDSGPGWHAIRDTLNVEVVGNTVTGSATFSEFFTGTGDRAAGSFEVNC